MMQHFTQTSSAYFLQCIIRHAQGNQWPDQVIDSDNQLIAAAIFILQCEELVATRLNEAWPSQMSIETNLRYIAETYHFKQI
jgi:hypothetical protein